MNDHTRRFTTAFHDHRRDERKHDALSGSRPPLFEQNPSAFTIAALCCGIPVEEAAKLIEKYASFRFEAGRLQGVDQAIERFTS